MGLCFSAHPTPGRLQVTPSAWGSITPCAQQLPSNTLRYYPSQDAYSIYSEAGVGYIDSNNSSSPNQTYKDDERVAHGLAPIVYAALVSLL